MNSPIVSTVIFAATYPAAWPPMPSATMKRPSETSSAYASSLCFLFRPTSVRPKASTGVIAPLAIAISNAPDTRAPEGAGRVRALAPETSSFHRALGPDFFERPAGIGLRGVPAHGILEGLLGLREETRLSEDLPGVLQENDVVRVEGDRGLEGFHRRPKVPGASRRESEVVVSPRVLRVLSGGEGEVAGRFREGAGAVGSVPLLDVVLDDRVDRAPVGREQPLPIVGLPPVGVAKDVQRLRQPLKPGLGFRLLPRRREVRMGLARERAKPLSNLGLAGLAANAEQRVVIVGLEHVFRVDRKSRILATNIRDKAPSEQATPLCRRSRSRARGRLRSPAGESAPLVDENSAGGRADDGRQIAIPEDPPELAHREALQERERDVERDSRISHERDRDGGPAHPLPVLRDPTIELLVEVPHRREAFDLVVRQRPRLEHGDSDELVGVADQDPALLAAALVREVDLLRDGHEGDPTVDGADEERALVLGGAAGSLRLPFHLRFALLVEVDVGFEVLRNPLLHGFGAGELLGAPGVVLAAPAPLVVEFLDELGEEPPSFPRQPRVLAQGGDERRLRDQARLIRDQRLLRPARRRLRQVQEGRIPHDPRPNHLFENERIVGLPSEHVQLGGQGVPVLDESDEPVGRLLPQRLVRRRRDFPLRVPNDDEERAERVFGLQRKQPARREKTDLPGRGAAAKQGNEILGIREAGTAQLEREITLAKSNPGVRRYGRPPRGRRASPRGGRRRRRERHPRCRASLGNLSALRTAGSLPR